MDCSDGPFALFGESEARGACAAFASQTRRQGGFAALSPHYGIAVMRHAPRPADFAGVRRKMESALS